MEIWHVLLGFSLPLLILNLYASLMVVRSSAFETAQKLTQLVLVWLLPYLGGLILLGVYREQRRSERPKQQVGNDPELTNSSVDHGAGD